MGSCLALSVITGAYSTGERLPSQPAQSRLHSLEDRCNCVATAVAASGTST